MHILAIVISANKEVNSSGIATQFEEKGHVPQSLSNPLLFEEKPPAHADCTVGHPENPQMPQAHPQEKDIDDKL